MVAGAGARARGTVMSSTEVFEQASDGLGDGVRPVRKLLCPEVRNWSGADARVSVGVEGGGSFQTGYWTGSAAVSASVGREETSSAPTAGAGFLAAPEGGKKVGASPLSDTDAEAVPLGGASQFEEVRAAS